MIAVDNLGNKVSCCDRCDSMFKEEPVRVFYLGRAFDKCVRLCPVCANRLYHWFKMECSRYGCDEE